MSKNTRRARRRRTRRKKGNWFTRLKLWQKILLCTAAVIICVLFVAVAYVYAMWNID